MVSITGKPGDEKIARNVELINKMAPPPALAALPKPAPAKLAKKTEAPQTVAKAVAKPAPPIPVVDTVASKPAPVAANPELEQTALAVAEQTNGVPDRSVVMQAVPFDPLAGPVKARARPAAAKKTAAKTAAKPVKQAQVPSLRVATEQY